jgi:DNA replication protein DnaC
MRAINAGYPIEDLVRKDLRSFQQSLELSDEDIERIEQPIIAPKQAEYQQQLAEAQRQREQEEEKARERSRQQEVLERQQREEVQRQERLRVNSQPTQKTNLVLQKVEIQTVTITGIEKAGFLGMGQPKVLTQRSVKQVEVFKEDLGKEVSLEMVGSMSTLSEQMN